MKIRRFKQFWQVVNDQGFTVANCMSEREAKDWIAINGFFPCASQEFGRQPVYKHKAYHNNRLIVYP